MPTLVSNARAPHALPVVGAALTLLPLRLAAEDQQAYERLQECMRVAEAMYYNCLLMGGGWVQEAACWATWTAARAGCLGAFLASVAAG